MYVYIVVLMSRCVFDVFYLALSVYIHWMHVLLSLFIVDDIFILLLWDIYTFFCWIHDNDVISHSPNMKRNKIKRGVNARG